MNKQVLLFSGLAILFSGLAILFSVISLIELGIGMIILSTMIGALILFYSIKLIAGYKEDKNHFAVPCLVFGALYGVYVGIVHTSIEEFSYLLPIIAIFALVGALFGKLLGKVF